MKKIYMLLAGALLWTTAGFSQNGDSCTVAVQIMADGDYTVAAMTGTGAIESGATAAAWFYYTATADGTINVSACAGGNGVDTRLFVYSGDCTNLVAVDNDDDGCDAPNGLASVVIDVPVVSGTTYYIAWDDRWSGDGFGFNFTYVPPPACTDVTGLTASDIMDDQATIVWNGDGNTAWDIKVDTAGFDIDLTTPTTVTDTFVTTLALMPETNYDAYVRTNCAEDGTSEWMMISFKTTCVPVVMTIPYFEDFEGVEIPEMPCSWLVNNINGDEYTWETMLDAGSQIMAVRWNSAMDMDDMTKTPELTLTGGTSYTLRFDLRTGSTNFLESLAVFYAGADGVAVDTLINMQNFGIVDWEIKTAEFTPPADGNYRIAFYGTSVADQLRIRVDNVSVVETPECAAPLAVMVSDITDVSATASWDNVGPDYQIVWDTVGFDPTGAIAVDVMDTTYDIMGLVAESNYEVYVRQNCGAGLFSPWVMGSFSTTPEPINGDSCSVANVIDANGQYDVSPLIGTGATDGAATAAAWFVYTPSEDGMIDVVSCYGGSDTRLWIYSGDCDNLTPVANTDDDCPHAPDSTGNSFAAALYEVPVSAGTTYYIEWDDRWSDNPFTFNFAWNPPPPCPAVMNLNVEVAGVQAIVTWDDDGVAYHLVTGEAGIDPDAETPIDLTEATYDIPGLLPGVNYDVYVRNNCDADGVSDWEMVSFATTNAIEGESFEGEVFPPEGWISIDADGDGFDWFPADAALGFNIYAGNFAAASASYDNATATALFPDNYLITPQLMVTDDNSELRYQVAAQDPAFAADKYGVWISVTGTEPSDFDTELFVETLAGSDWGERTVDLSTYIGQDVYLAFRHYDVTDMFVMKIDNVILPDFVDAVAETEKVDFSIYPNPNSGQFSVANIGATGDYLIEIIDVTGKVVYSENQTLVSGEQKVINADNVRMGVYMVKLTNTQENYYRTERMIIK